MTTKTKTIVIFKSFSKTIRDSKIEDFKNVFPQFQIYKDFRQSRQYEISYQIKAKGAISDIEKYLKSQEQTKNSPLQPIIDLLKNELKPLRVIFIEKMKEWAIKDYNNCLRIAKMNREELLQKYGKEAEVKNCYTNLMEKKIVLDFNTRGMIEYCKNVVRKSLDEYIDKAKDQAEAHYQSSLIKLATRINRKDLNINNMKANTEYSEANEVNINITTTLSDGIKSVKAWTIIASGEIQRPHYRYLVK
jgi:hypothetical protein